MGDENQEKLELQFDRAEPSHAPNTSAPATPGPVQCASCGSRLLSYYSVNGRVTCRRCRDAAVASQGGSHLPTLATAGALGLLAAILGAAIYYGVARVTGYEIGFVSIIVGLLVGKAVRKGARGRGGWRYRTLAVLLCYLSIACSYFASVVSAMGDPPEPPAAAQSPAAEAPQQGAPAGAAPDGAAVAPRDATQPAADAVPPDDAAEPANEPEESSPEGLAPFAMLILFVLKLPFLMGAESPMTFLLVGIALWEAWKFNREEPFTANGPYAVGGVPESNG